ncbi:MAG TPA: hypothetical protein PLF38_04630 [Xylanibacter oryzae]|nr:hypothetical protein [Xylanibacter oryzae]
MTVFAGGEENVGYPTKKRVAQNIKKIKSTSIRQKLEKYLANWGK